MYIRHGKTDVERIKEKSAFIIDMDGVIYHGNKILPGVTDFIAWLKIRAKNSVSHQRQRKDTKELHEKLLRLGINVSEDHFIQVPQRRPVS